MKSFSVLDCNALGQQHDEKKEEHKKVFHFQLDFRGKKLRMNKTLHDDSNAHSLVQYILWFVVGVVKVSAVFISIQVGIKSTFLRC